MSGGVAVLSALVTSTCALRSRGPLQIGGTSFDSVVVWTDARQVWAHPQAAQQVLLEVGEQAIHLHAIDLGQDLLLLLDSGSLTGKPLGGHLPLQVVTSNKALDLLEQASPRSAGLLAQRGHVAGWQHIAVFVAKRDGDLPGMLIDAQLNMMVLLLLGHG